MQNDSNFAITNLQPKDSDSDTENQNRYQCPNCQSENTQKIEMAFLSGTFKGTQLESQVKPPKKIEWMPGWLYFSSIAFSIWVVWTYFNFFGWKPWHTESIIWYAREATGWEQIKFLASLLLVGFGGAVVCSLVFWRPLNKRAVINEVEYQAACDRWKYEFICHKCGHRFLVRSLP